MDLSELIGSLKKKILKLPFYAASEGSAVEKCVSTKPVVSEKTKFVLYCLESAWDAMYFNVRFVDKTINKDEAKCFQVDARVLQMQAG